MKLKEIPTNAEEIDFDENNNEEEELSTAEKLSIVMIRMEYRKKNCNIIDTLWQLA